LISEPPALRLLLSSQKKNKHSRIISKESKKIYRAKTVYLTYFRKISAPAAAPHSLQEKRDFVK
jgi:hypothetical protein